MTRNKARTGSIALHTINSDQHLNVDSLQRRLQLSRISDGPRPHDHVSRTYGESLLTPFRTGLRKLFPFTKRLNSNTAPILPAGQRPLSPALAETIQAVCQELLLPFCKHSELHHQA